MKYRASVALVAIQNDFDGRIRARTLTVSRRHNQTVCPHGTGHAADEDLVVRSIIQVHPAVAVELDYLLQPHACWVGAWLDEWMDEWMSGWMDGWMDGWTNEWPEERTNTRTDGRTDGRKNAQKDGSKANGDEERWKSGGPST